MVYGCPHPGGAVLPGLRIPPQGGGGGSAGLVYGFPHRGGFPHLGGIYGCPHPGGSFLPGLQTPSQGGWFCWAEPPHECPSHCAWSTPLSPRRQAPLPVRTHGLPAHAGGPRAQHCGRRRGGAEQGPGSPDAQEVHLQLLSTSGRPAPPSTTSNGKASRAGPAAQRILHPLHLQDE
eukprot:gene1386-biopygen12318